MNQKTNQSQTSSLYFQTPTHKRTLIERIKHVAWHFAQAFVLMIFAMLFMALVRTFLG